MARYVPCSATEAAFPGFDQQRRAVEVSALAYLRADGLVAKADALPGLEHTLEGLLRTVPAELRADVGPNPGEADGVFILDTTQVTQREFLARGRVWLVSTQKTAPILIRFRVAPDGVTTNLLVVRFGVEGMTLAKDDLERIWRRGRFPDEHAGWCMVISTGGPTSA